MTMFPARGVEVNHVGEKGSGCLRVKMLDVVLRKLEEKGKVRNKRINQFSEVVDRVLAPRANRASVRTSTAHEVRKVACLDATGHERSECVGLKGA